MVLCLQGAGHKHRACKDSQPHKILLKGTLDVQGGSQVTCGCTQVTIPSEWLSKGSVLKRVETELPPCLPLSFQSLLLSLLLFPSRGSVDPPHLPDKAHKQRITSYRCNPSCKAFTIKHLSISKKETYSLKLEKKKKKKLKVLYWVPSGKSPWLFSANWKFNS